MNLAINARDAMPEGGRLTIATDETAGHEDEGHTGSAPSPKVRLRVSDQGIGMPPEVIKRAFDPFFTTKPRGQGTGLGLSTVYSIVRNSGGTVAISSKMDAGTTITILLPVVAVAPAPVRNRPADTTAGGHERVLVVEDDEALRAAVSRILSDRGYRVLAAPDGVAALEVFDQAQGGVDLVLTDMAMPRMRGDQLAVEILLRRPDMPIIFMSGDAGSIESTSTLLAKPVTEEVLLRAIRTELGGSHSGGQRRSDGQ